MKNNFIIGRTSGKLGDLVGYVRGGKQFARVYVPHIANPNTERQQVSRKKMAVVSDLGRGLGRVLAVGYGADANSRVSPRNIFSRETIPAGKGIIKGSTPATVEVDYEKVQVSNGKIPVQGVAYGDVDVTTPLKVIVPFDAVYQTYDLNHTSGGELQSVAVFVVVYSKTLGVSAMASKILYDKTTNTWLDANSDIQVVLPGEWQGSFVEVYAFCKQLPDALNGVPVETMPYRIPGNCTPTVYLGNGRIA